MASKDKKQNEKDEDWGKSEIMHRLKTHPFLFIGTVLVLIIIIIAFVFVPAIVPSAYGSGDLVFGHYNKVPIKYVMNNYFYQAQQYLYQRQSLAQDDPDFLYRFAQIWRQAFEETVIHVGMQDEMKQAGYVAPVDVVDRQMAELPQFQDNGRFSSTRFREMDSNTRMNLWHQVRESIAVAHYMSDISGLRTSSTEVSFIGTMASPKRNFDVVVFAANTYPDSEVDTYARANPSLFRSMRLSRITINSSEREARLILESIRNGTTTFEEAARTNSQDWAAERGGDIGSMMAYDLVYEISNEQARERVISLAAGELSDVTRTSSGWVFFRADEASRPIDLNDSSQRTRVRNYILAFQRGQVEDWLISEAERFASAAGTRGFDTAAAEANISKLSFGPIPLNYGNSPIFSSISSAGITELANAGSNDTFWRAAFSTPLNSVSAPLVVGDNVIVLCPLEEVQAEEDELEMVKLYYPYWISGSMENSHRSYFLTNRKLDDRFQETFWKIWGEN